ncbi:MAG: selenide, water dikinase SelD [Gemmataceae bacterium]|nr:selenide, water dikinase SelD [Gemmataceae bacterium]
MPRSKDPNLLVGTETHDDAGVFKLTDEIALVQTVDFFPPVVDDPYLYGQIAAANALSDVYAMGGIPKTALNLVAYPDDEDPQLTWLGKILEGGAERCMAAGAVIAGGHTIRDKEIKFGLSVTGIVHPDKVLTNAGAKPGDRLVLTKPLGTGFVTTAHKANACPEALFKAACFSMVQLNKVGADALQHLHPHGMTDITGYGFAGHALEMALGSNTTLVFELQKLPRFAGIETLIAKRFFTRASKTNREYILPHLRVEGNPDKVSMELALDAQTSGGLLVSLPKEEVALFIKAALANGAICAVEVGEVHDKGPHHLVFKP